MSAPTIHPVDLVIEACTALGARPARLVLTVAGVVLGVSSVLVATGLTASARSSILASFDRNEASTVVASRGDGGDLDPAALDRVRSLRGVRTAGLVRSLPGISATVVSAPGASARRATVATASPGFADPAGAAVATGRTFDAGHERRGSEVAVVGAAAADLLGIDQVDGTTSVLIGGRALVVVAILQPASRWSPIDDLVIVPSGWATAHLATAPSAATLVIVTQLGAGAAIGRQVPEAAVPDDPRSVESDAPPDLSGRRVDVARDLDAMTVVIGVLGLVGGALAIANTTLVAVFERLAEIALRRSLGASRGAIAGQFLVESAITGVLGGAVGAAIALLLLVVACAVRGWPLVLPGTWIVGGPVVGAGVGVIAGALPAWRASTIAPAEILRGTR